MTPSVLFGKEKYKIGEYSCFYCGASCDDEFKTKDYVKDTFTNIDIVKCRESVFVCGGCVEAFSSDIDIVMINGEIRNHTWTRLYSWIITPERNIAATKSHMKELRELILNPPEPPFIIALSDSGKKNIIFRSEIAYDKNNFPVTLEEEIINVNTEELKNVFNITTNVSASIGKVALLNPEKIQYAIAYEKHHGNLDHYEEWLKIYKKPIARLAAWLTKNKEDSQNEYPAINTGTIQTENSGGKRSDKKNGRLRADRIERGDDQIYFDFTGDV